MRARVVGWVSETHRKYPAVTQLALYNGQWGLYCAAISGGRNNNDNAISYHQHNARLVDYCMAQQQQQQH